MRSVLHAALAAIAIQAGIASAHGIAQVEPPTQSTGGVRTSASLACEVIDELVPQVVPASELLWPSGPKSDDLVAAIGLHWSSWLQRRKDAAAHARERCMTLESEGRNGAGGVVRGWPSVLGNLETRLKSADDQLASDLLASGAPTVIADEVCRRARRQIWLASNLKSGRSPVGRRIDIFEACGNASAYQGATLACCLPAWTAWASDVGAWTKDSEGKSAVLPPEGQWTAWAERFDGLWLEAERARWAAMRKVWEEVEVARPPAWKDSLRRLDRLQEDVADSVMQRIGNGASLDAFRWRHSDRVRAYPMLAARGAPDKLFDRIEHDAHERAALAGANEMLMRAENSYLAYAREREADERILLRIMLRDSTRGFPLPAAMPEGMPIDPDLKLWERALDHRMKAAQACVAQLLELLPEAIREEARRASSEMTQEEVNSYFSAIPRP